jgi:hypothetical protein
MPFVAYKHLSTRWEVGRRWQVGPRYSGIGTRDSGHGIRDAGLGFEVWDWGFGGRRTAERRSASGVRDFLMDFITTEMVSVYAGAQMACPAVVGSGRNTQAVKKN